MRMRMQEDGGAVRIYSAEGELIGNVADDNSYAVQGAGALGQGKDGKVYAAALATENVTAEDDPVTLVSNEPGEVVFFYRCRGIGAENAKAVRSTGTIYQWNMVAAGVSDGFNFILLGIQQHCIPTVLEDAEFTRAQGSLGDALRYGRNLRGNRSGWPDTLYRSHRRCAGTDGSRRGHLQKDPGEDIFSVGRS